LSDELSSPYTRLVHIAHKAARFALPILAALGLTTTGCALMAPFPGVSTRVTVIQFDARLMFDQQGGVFVIVDIDAAGNGPVEIRIPTRVTAANGGGEHVVTTKRFDAIGGFEDKPAHVTHRRDGTIDVYQVTTTEFDSQHHHRYLISWDMDGLVDAMPDGSGTLDWDILAGLSGMTVQSATVYITPLGYGSMNQPDQLVCAGVDDCAVTWGGTDQANYPVIATISAKNLTLDGNTHLGVSAHWPAGTFTHVPVVTTAQSRSQQVMEASVWLLVLAITLAVALRLFAPLFLSGMLGRRAHQSPESNGRGTHKMGFLYSDEQVESGNRLAAIAGKVVANWIITGAVLMVTSAIGAAVLAYHEIDSFSVLLTLTWIGMLGGIVLPFILFATVGVTIGAVHGAQSTSHHGWPLGLALGFWFVGGLYVCDFFGVTELTNHALDTSGVPIVLHALVPWWVYPLVMAALVAGFFQLRKNTFGQTANAVVPQTPDETTDSGQTA